MSSRRICIALATVLLTACAAAPVQRSPLVAPTEPVVSVTADDNLNAVAWTQTAIEHDLVYREVYRSAHQQLAAALADPSWDALPRNERSNTPAGLPAAVIVDVDETVLDNSPYQARLVRDHASFDESTWAQWCREASARPLPGALEFTRFAAQNGVTVFYLSNRAQDLEQATLKNLRDVGFPVDATKNVFLGLGTVVPGCEQHGSDKGCRRRLVAQDHRVLMQFGDQIGDFLDIPVNTVDGRQHAIQPYLDWIGERWFVLPNPTYGSWESALFDNQWSAPAEQRRRDKVEALRMD